MGISQKRIRSLSRHLTHVRRESTIVLAVDDSVLDEDILQRIGFTGDVSDADAVLPSVDFGPTSRFNAEGKVKIHKDRPMETAYRQVEWTWEEWNGPYDRVEKSKIVDVPYMRYPRTRVPPPGIELTIRKRVNGSSLVVSPAFVYGKSPDDVIVHTINLFLEIFGQCDVLSEALEEIICAPVRRLNWEVLPEGQHPWNNLRPRVKRVIDGRPEGNKPVIEHRLETINSHGPTFVAIGQAGFRGYLIFGFPEKKLFVLESAYTGNATYVFAEDWEHLSQLTKAQILSDGAQEDRIIHREGWDSHIARLLA